MSETAAEWLERVAQALGVAPPDPAEREALLELAGVAARTSERIAAPLSCWLVGRAGLDPAAALGLVRRLAETGRTEAGRTEAGRTEAGSVESGAPEADGTT